MSKYKSGDKIVITIKESFINNIYGKLYSTIGYKDIPEEHIDQNSEPLSVYTKPLEFKINNQAEEITRLLVENKKLKTENEKMLVKIDAYELYGDQHEEEYNQAFNQGADKAWELARKINDMDIYDTEEIFIEAGAFHLGNVLENYTYSEAAAKVEAWEKAKEEIKVGDIIKVDVNGLYAIVIHESDEFAKVVYADGNVYLGRKDGMTKTGRHIDIDSFLKQTGEE